MSYQATNGGGPESGFFKSIQALGNNVGFGVSILVTPAVFRATRAPLFSYLSDTVGHEIGYWLTWAMGGVEAIFLYRVTALVFPAAVVWVMTTLADRRFRDGR